MHLELHESEAMEKQSQWSSLVREHSKRLTVDLDAAKPVLTGYAIEKMTPLMPGDANSPMIVDTLEAAVLVSADYTTQERIRPILQMWVLRSLKESGLCGDLKLGPATVKIRFEHRDKSKEAASHAG